MNRCKHFNGVQHNTCEAGVLYVDVEPKGHRLPCIPPFNERCASLPAGECSSFVEMTDEELAEEKKERDVRVAEVLGLLQEGKCFVCKAPIEPSRIVGRCKYASCGHRLGQV